MTVQNPLLFSENSIENELLREELHTRTSEYVMLASKSYSILNMLLCVGTPYPHLRIRDDSKQILLDFEYVVVNT